VLIAYDEEVIDVKRLLSVTMVCLLALTATPADARDREPIVPNFEELAPTFITTAQGGFKFLDIPVGARPAGMGDAFTGVAGDITSLFWNPAALAFLRGREAFFAHTQWIADIKHDAGGFAVNVPGRGTFGVGFVTMDPGKFDRTEVDPNPASKGFIDRGTFTTTHYAVTVAYAYQITDRFGVGGTAKLAHEDLGMGDVFRGGQRTQVQNKKTALAVDLSTHFNTGFRNTAMAMSIQNFSGELIYQRERFELPRNIRVGFLLDLVSLSGRRPTAHYLSFLFDFTNPVDFDERIHLGSEYTYRPPRGAVGFSLRAGYKVNHDTEDFSAGAGLQYKTAQGRGVKVDYAFKHFDKQFFDAVHILSGGITF